MTTLSYEDPLWERPPRLSKTIYRDHYLEVKEQADDSLWSWEVRHVLLAVNTLISSGVSASEPSARVAAMKATDALYE